MVLAFGFWPSASLMSVWVSATNIYFAASLFLGALDGRDAKSQDHSSTQSSQPVKRSAQRCD